MYCAGGAPNAADINLAWRFAVGALRACEEKASGYMVAWRDGKTQYVPLRDVAGRDRLVPEEIYTDFCRVMPEFIRTRGK